MTYNHMEYTSTLNSTSKIVLKKKKVLEVTEEQLLGMKFFSSVFGEKTTSSSTEEQPHSRDVDFIKLAKDSRNKAWDIMFSDNWKLEKKSSEGDTVHSKHLPGMGKIFLLTAEANFPAKRLAEVLFHKTETTTVWNKSLILAKRIKWLDDSTDLIHHVSAPAAGGLVSSRDFVSVRHFGRRNDGYFCAGVSVDHPDYPPHNNYVRGENGPGGWIIEPISGVSDRCKFQWLINSRLNGWLPQYLVDMAFTDVLLDYMKYVRSYGEKLRNEGLMD